jgi:hypothetical protein
MKIELENGLRFLANFRYSIKDSISKSLQSDDISKFADLKTGDYGKFNSECD